MKKSVSKFFVLLTTVAVLLSLAVCVHADDPVKLYPIYEQGSGALVAENGKFYASYPNYISAGDPSLNVNGITIVNTWRDALHFLWADTWASIVDNDL